MVAAAKKGKEIDSRSKAWEHFERVKDNKGVTIKVDVFTVLRLLMLIQKVMEHLL